MIPQATQTQPVKISEAKREKLGLSLLERINQARQGMRTMLDNIRIWRDFYENNLPPKTDPWEKCSNLNVPLTQWVVDTRQSQLTDVILGVKPYALVRPIEPADKQTAVWVENLLQNVMEKKMKCEAELDITFLDALLSPASITKVMWEEDYRKTKQVVSTIDQFSGEETTVVADLAVPKYVGPRIEHVDLANFVIYPLTSRIDKAQLVGDRYRLSTDEVKRRVKAGIFDKKYAQKVIESPETENATEHESEFTDDEAYDGVTKLETQYHYFWEVITGYDADGDGLLEECLVTLDATSGTIVRIIEYPYWHGRRCYIPWIPLPRPRRFFGRTVPQVVEHIQRELNTLHNQRIDSVALTINKVFKLLESSPLKEDAIESRPGGVIRVSSMDELQELDINPIVPGIQEEVNALNYGERAVGVTDNTLGKRSEGEKTAREVAIVASNEGIRISDMVRRMQCSMVELCEQILGLCYQFMDDEEIMSLAASPVNPFTMTNQPGTDQPMQVELSREDLVKRYDFMPHGNTGTANKVQQREEALLLYRELGANPLVAQDLTRIHRVTRDLLVAFDRDDVNNYIGTEQEAQTRMMAMQQLMAAQMQPGMEMNGPTANPGTMGNPPGGVGAGQGAPTGTPNQPPGPPMQ